MSCYFYNRASSVGSDFRVLVLGIYYGVMGTVIFIKVQIVTGCFAVANFGANL